MRTHTHAYTKVGWISGWGTTHENKLEGANPKEEKNEDKEERKGEVTGMIMDKKVPEHSVRELAPGVDDESRNDNHGPDSAIIDNHDREHSYHGNAPFDDDSVETRSKLDGARACMVMLDEGQQLRVPWLPLYHPQYDLTVNACPTEASQTLPSPLAVENLLGRWRMNHEK